MDIGHQDPADDWAALIKPDLEGHRRSLGQTTANDLAVRRALESAGVEFIDENGVGPGVRLRKAEAGESVKINKIASLKHRLSALGLSDVNYPAFAAPYRFMGKSKSEGAT